MSFIFCFPIGTHLHIIELNLSPTVSITHVVSNFTTSGCLLLQLTIGANDLHILNNQSVLLIESYESKVHPLRDQQSTAV